MTKITALYRAAQKATPRDPGDGLNIDYGYEEIGFGPARTSVHGDVGKELTEADFDLIALADPQTVMALIEVYRAAMAWRYVPDFSPRCVFCNVEAWPHTDFRGTPCPIGQLCDAIEKVAAPA